MANSRIPPNFYSASYDKIQSYIAEGVITYPSYVFCKDKNTLVFVDKDLKIQDVKGFGQSSIVEVNDLPTSDILSNTFYICKGVGYLLIGEALVPVFKNISESDEGVDSYDNLKNVPLVNKYGNVGEPVVLSELDDGSYSVNGHYQIGGNLTTTYVPLKNVMFLVESDEENKYITRLSGKNICVYKVNLESSDVVSDEYVTQSWIQRNGYATESYVTQAIEDLYNRIAEDALVNITKISQLENDIGYLTESDFKEISTDIIAGLF